MSSSIYLRNAILNAVRGTSYSATSIVASLHTQDPGVTGSHEVIGGSYARQVITFATASNATVVSSIDVIWSVPGATTITNIGIWDNLGNFLMGGPLNFPQIFIGAGTYKEVAGNISALLSSN